MNDRQFPAKLLLFGEYTVLDGGRALAIPIHKWSGHWAESDQGPDTRLIQLGDFVAKSTVGGDIDLPKMRASINSGLQFISDIPVGYGVGSSGALTAALLHEFGRPGVKRDADLVALQGILSAIESFFHGKSSGLDPLVSYTDMAIVRELGILRPTQLIPNAGLTIFLVDSGLPRKTDVLVAAYNAMKTDNEFAVLHRTMLLPAVEHAIAFFLMGQTRLFWEQLRLISEIQFHHFRPMIPDNMRDVWSRTRATDSVLLKLCGAGGGGFFLGFTTDPKRAREIIGNDLLIVSSGI